MDGLRHQGFLRKRGHRFKNWKRRFFVLQDDSITYSESQGSKIKGQLRLTAASRVEDVDLKKFGKPFCLAIIASVDEKEPLFIQASSTDELCSWREAILRSVSALSDVSAGVTMAQHRKISSGVVLSGVATAGEGVTVDGVPGVTDPPSWLRTGLLNRALKEDWQQNFFVLHNNGLLQGFNKKGGKVVAEVNVAKFTARALAPAEVGGFNFCFQLQKPGTKIPLTLQAASDEECASWLDGIQQLRGALLALSPLRRDSGGAGLSSGSSAASSLSAPGAFMKSGSEASLSSVSDVGELVRDGFGKAGSKGPQELAAAIVAAAAADAKAENSRKAAGLGTLTGIRLLNPDVKVDF